MNNVISFVRLRTEFSGDNDKISTISTFRMGNFKLNESMRKYFFVFAFLTISFYHASGTTITSKTTGGTWTLGTTWVGNIAPGVNDDVVIAGTVNLSSTVSVKSLTINTGKTLNITGSSSPVFTAILVSGLLSFNSSGSMSGTSLTINSGGFFTLSGGGIVSLTGNFTNNGTFSDSSLGTISFDGTTTQTIDNPTLAVDFNNINVSSGAIVTLAATAIVNLNGTLTLNGTGSFDADGPGGGTFTVISYGIGAMDSGVSTPSGGKIAELPTPANFTGGLDAQPQLDQFPRERNLQDKSGMK